MVQAVNFGLSRQSNVSHQDSRRRPTHTKELLQFYGLVLAVENTYGNDSKHLRAHFSAVKVKYGKVQKLGYDRYSAIVASFIPSILDLQQVAKLLNECALAHIIVESVSIDSLNGVNSCNRCLC